jgi:hypothetical protein
VNGAFLLSQRARTRACGRGYRQANFGMATSSKFDQSKTTGAVPAISLEFPGTR